MPPLVELFNVWDWRLEEYSSLLDLSPSWSMESEDSELSSRIALSCFLVNFTDFSRFFNETLVEVFLLRTLTADPTELLLYIVVYCPKAADTSPLDGVSFIGLNCIDGVGATLDRCVGFSLLVGGSMSLSMTSLNTLIISLSSSPLLIPPYLVNEMFDLANLLWFLFRAGCLANNDAVLDLRSNYSVADVLYIGFGVYSPLVPPLRRDFDFSDCFVSLSWSWSSSSSTTLAFFSKKLIKISCKSFEV